MKSVKSYFVTTLWRAILKLVTIVVLGVVWLANPESLLVMGVFVGACVLWIIDGCDHGIDALRATSARRASGSGTA